MAIARMMLTIAGNIASLMDEIRRLGDLVDQAMIAELYAWGLAMYWAQAQVSTTAQSVDSVDALVADVQSAKRELALLIELAQHRGLLAANSIKLIGGNSYNGWAHDVRSMGTVVLNNMSKLGRAIGADPKRVHAAIARADELSATLSKNAEMKEKLIGAAHLRNATFALSLKAVRETERAVDFTRFHRGDAAKYCPSVYNFGSRRRANEVERIPKGEPAVGGLASPVPITPAATMPSGDPNVPSKPIAPSRRSDSKKETLR